MRSGYQDNYFYFVPAPSGDCSSSCPHFVVQARSILSIRDRFDKGQHRTINGITLFFKNHCIKYKVYKVSLGYAMVFVRAIVADDI